MEIKIDTAFTPFFLLANTKIEVRELPFFMQVGFHDLYWHATASFTAR